MTTSSNKLEPKVIENVILREAGTNINQIYMSEETLRSSFDPEKTYPVSINGTYYPHSEGILLDKVIGEITNLSIDEKGNLVGTCKFFDNIQQNEVPHTIKAENVYGAGYANVSSIEGITVATNYKFSHAYISFDNDTQ